MANKWNSNGNRDIGGILRKTNQITLAENEQRLGELLVFGYACKIFRDDERARHIDQGKHLIPWMGDDSLKIDRYDVRAALPDISLYEPPPGGYMNRMEYLTPAEQRAEQLCEEERYYSLYNNEEEEQMYQEEELKRLHREGATSYGQVQFDYNNTQPAQETSKDNTEKSEEPDEIFQPPQNFIIPMSITTPETMKQHAIIERTAKFISTQGPQMEILIKAKQSNNPQFEFLIQNNKLNSYYKFVLNAFKIGTYPETILTNKIENKIPSPEPVPVASKKEDTTPEPPPPTPHPVFVHPSLIRIPKIKYKPSADCAYTQLISKIKGVPIPQEEANDDTNKHEVVEESAPSLYYSSYYTTNYLEHDDSYSTDHSAAILAQQSLEQEAEAHNEENGVQINKISSGLMLAQCYASDTEDENEADDIASYIPEHYTIPPESLQNIIDKTAIYVAKNGKQFEEILRSKDDERFTFLDSSNEFYPYYLHKVIGLNNNYVPSRLSGSKSKNMTPVSFSIKSKDDSAVPINPALLQETSDDDDPENKSNRTQTNQQNQSSNVPGDKPAIPVPSPKALLAAATAARISAAIAANAAKNGTNISASTRTRFDIDNTGTVVSRANANGGVVSVTGSTTSGTNKLETSHQKELKRAEEKVKDRLALIAREKLGLISKEKQLQLERKKRAMAFLNQIKGSGTSVSESTSPQESTTPPLNNSIITTSQGGDDDSDVSSAHSIPISSYQNNDKDGNDGKNQNRRSKSVECLDPVVEQKPKSTAINNNEIIEIIDNDTEVDTNGKQQSSRKRNRTRDHHDHRDREKKRRRSSSHSKESSSRHRHKKKKSKHSKKKSKKHSRSRSPLKTKRKSPEKSKDKSREKKHSKKSISPISTKKSKKRKSRER